MPIPLIVIGAVILFFVLLLALRVRISILYSEEVRLTLGVLFFRFTLYPRKKKVKWQNYSPKKAAKIAAKKAKKQAKKEAKKAKKAAKKKAEKALSPEEQKPKATLKEKILLVRALAAALIRKTGKHLKLKAARLRIKVATGDAAKTAVLYGAVCQSLAYLLALLDRVTKLKAATPDVAVEADFLGEKPSADISLHFSLRLWGALAIGLSVAIAYLRGKQEQKRERKKKAAQKARADKAQKGARHG